MEPYSFEEICTLIDNAFGKPSLSKQLYECGVNTPSKIDFYKQYENTLGVMEYAVDIFKKITYITPQTFIPMVYMFEDRYVKEKR